MSNPSCEFYVCQRYIIVAYQPCTSASVHKENVTLTRIKADIYCDEMPN